MALDRDEAKKLIVGLIASGAIEPDAQVSERSLAQRTGLGRTPIREALQDLHRDGLIAIVPKHGSVVRRLGLEEVREIFEVRFALESAAASLAAMRGPSQRLRELDAEFAAYDGEELNEAAAQHYRQIGHEFHNEIVNSARNRLLIRQYSQVRLMIEVSLSLTEGQEIGRTKASIVEHHRISRAIMSGDADAAQAEMQSHLRAGHEIRTRLLMTPPDLLLKYGDDTEPKKPQEINKETTR
ncbi:GntR family transcriptional regulator [Paralimibaculum aggregatum]|uniref:GntR family transcriptional regulator n=1 Tax=Paralimibaculum aggregatum TaxID=3036245 RepID=A0ABQ6LSZ9_9RHOB|nr:GntR family transcriptional regulator [Limibaculum sp. NKW23]GMG85199.1 GntR family transcriptional regulator [Limibaculum sp. NKW23]